MTATKGVVDLGTAHVVAASMALVLGLVLLARRKGEFWHVRLGQLYLAVMVVVVVPVLFVYEITGRPGPSTCLRFLASSRRRWGWLSVRRRAHSRPGVVAHATLLAWSWIGVLTAVLAQLANHDWPEDSPWPVLVVVWVATLAGAVAVPRFVSRALAMHRRAGP